MAEESQSLAFTPNLERLMDTIIPPSSSSLPWSIWSQFVSNLQVSLFNVVPFLSFPFHSIIPQVKLQLPTHTNLSPSDQLSPVNSIHCYKLNLFLISFSPAFVSLIQTSQFPPPFHHGASEGETSWSIWQRTWEPRPSAFNPNPSSGQLK